MTDEQTPAGEPTPSTDPPPLAPLVQQAAAPTPPAVPPPVAPPVAWGAPPVAAVAKGGRTTLAAIAGVGLMILGILGGLLGLLIAVFGSSIVGQLDLNQYGDFGGLNDPAAVVSGFLAFIGIVVVVYSLVYLIGGIGIVRSRGWGRVMGLIVGIVSSLFWLASLTGSGTGSSSAANSMGFVLVMLAIHIYVVVALAFFWRRKSA